MKNHINHMFPNSRHISGFAHRRSASHLYYIGMHITYGCACECVGYAHKVYEAMHDTYHALGIAPTLASPIY